MVQWPRAGNSKELLTPLKLKAKERGKGRLPVTRGCLPGTNPANPEPYAREWAGEVSVSALPHPSSSSFIVPLRVGAGGQGSGCGPSREKSTWRGSEREMNGRIVEIRHSVLLSFICTSETWLSSYRCAVLLLDTHRVGEGDGMGMTVRLLFWWPNSGAVL